MPYLIASVSGAFIATYLLIVYFLVVGWIRAQRIPVRASLKHAQSDGAESLVSVLIAARNEADRLPLLIRDLQQQTSRNFEVIVVNDRSDDDTVSMALGSIGGDSRFRVIDALATGKKAALSQGVLQAKGNIILTTDADCRVGTNWIAEMTTAFADPTLMLAFGPVRIIGSSFFDKLQSLEFASLIGTSAATAALQRPAMCNGANLSYRKAAFKTVGGYSSNIKIPSGDDEFLMRKILEAYPASVQYSASPGAWVTTTAAPTLKAFFYQRVRWAGKWKYNDSPTSQLLAAFIFVFHLGVVLLPWLSLFNFIAADFVVALLATKAAAELIYLKTVAKRLALPWSWTAFFGLQLIYSYYVVVVAICGQFIEFEWKGRRLKSFLDKESAPQTSDGISTSPNSPRR